MKRYALSMIALAAAAGTLVVTSCDWESGSQANFNNSNLSNLTNISGFYQGTMGGRAVRETSNGNINHLTIQQSGNRIEVVDNQGSRYEGTVGAPLAVAGLQVSQIPAGAVLTTYQVSWTGRDNVAARDVEFTGTINFVTVTDVRGETFEGESESSRESSTEFSDGTDGNGNGNGNGEENGEENGGDAGNGSGPVETVSRSSSSESTTTRGQTTEFELTEQNTQLRLRGTWVENGGRVSEVDARASGILFNLTDSPEPDQGVSP